MCVANWFIVIDVYRDKKGNGKRKMTHDDTHHMYTDTYKNVKRTIFIAEDLAIFIETAFDLLLLANVG